MAKEPTTVDVNNGDDLNDSWGKQVKADIESLFTCKEIQATAYAADKEIDLDDGDIQSIELTGDIALSLVNQKLNRPFCLVFKQDGTGGHGITFFDTVLWAYGCSPSPATDADKYNVYMFIPIAYDDPDWTYLGFILGEDHG